MNMSYDSTNLTTPDIKWLGVRPSDLDRFNIPDQCRLPMTEEDIRTGKKMVCGYVCVCVRMCTGVVGVANVRFLWVGVRCACVHVFVLCVCFMYVSRCGWRMHWLCVCMWEGGGGCALCYIKLLFEPYCFYCGLLLRLHHSFLFSYACTSSMASLWRLHQLNGVTLSA